MTMTDDDRVIPGSPDAFDDLLEVDSSDPTTVGVRIPKSPRKLKTPTAVVRRSSSPIAAYVGPNGHGKTLCMIRDSIPTLEAGRQVLSTVRIVDPHTGNDHPSYAPFTDLAQLLDVRQMLVLMDEVTGVASAQDSAKLDVRVSNVLMQLRKVGSRLWWTAPAWDRAAKPIRQVTQSVTECRGFLAKSSDTEDGLAIWAPKRLFRLRTFAATDFENWTEGKRDRLSPEIKQWMWGPSSGAFDYYDTYGAVERVSGITPEGIHEVCGGRITVPTCKCDRTQ